MVVSGRVRQLFERGCFWLAVVLPLASAATRASADPAWRDDLPLLRGLGLQALGLPQTLSMLGMQAASLVPLGPLAYRMALVSALALGACAALIQVLARRLLDRHVPGAFINAPLAAIAALTATLGPAMQAEATVGGGQSVALAACLACLALLSHPTWPKPRRYVLAALSWGLVCTESLVAGAAAAVVLIAAAVIDRGRPSQRVLAWSAAVAASTAGLLTLPWLIRPLSPHGSWSLGAGLDASSLVSIKTATEATTALVAWKAEVGIVALSVGAVGIAAGLWRARTRTMVLPMALVIAADVVLPVTSDSGLVADPLTALRTLALAALSISAALGFQTMATTLIDLGLPMARPVAVLILVFDLTLVAVVSEQSAFAVDRSAMRGATTFTDEALEGLEPGALVLARSRPLVWRLLAAQSLYGQRPDVLVVPLPLLHHDAVTLGVLTAEPSAALMLRDVAIQGHPGEHGLARVTDHRPVYAELDPSWGETIATHVTPDGLWLRVHAHPVGSSDRRLAVEASGKRLERIMRDVRTPEWVDTATQAVVSASLRQQAVALAMARDKTATRKMMERIEQHRPGDLFVRALEQRLDHARGSLIDTRGLLQ